MLWNVLMLSARAFLFRNESNLSPWNAVPLDEQEVLRTSTSAVFESFADLLILDEIAWIERTAHAAAGAEEDDHVMRHDDHVMRHDDHVMRHDDHVMRHGTLASLWCAPESCPCQQRFLVAPKDCEMVVTWHERSSEQFFLVLFLRSIFGEFLRSTLGFL